MIRVRSLMSSPHLVLHLPLVVHRPDQDLIHRRLLHLAAPLNHREVTFTLKGDSSSQQVELQTQRFNLRDRTSMEKIPFRKMMASLTCKGGI